MRPRGNRNVLVFIHGYNTLFAEGALSLRPGRSRLRKRQASRCCSPGRRAASSADYIYDTNSATAARDGLEHTLRLVLASDADHVNILAHSMGNWVTVEALRQIKISGDLKHMDKIGYIFLAAPDIDLDVFKSEMQRFGKPKKPFYIVLSQDDKALGLSKFIAGGEGRVGADENIDELAALGATVIDLTDVKADDSTNHGKFAQLAEVAPQLQVVLRDGVGTNPGDSRQEAAGSALGSIISLPTMLLGGADQDHRRPIVRPDASRAPPC